MFTTEESWNMSEPEKVAAIIAEVGVRRLGHWDGCCCCHFSIRNVDIDISCGKGREQAVWVSSPSLDYEGEVSLRPIMAEVIHQLKEESGRWGEFAQFFHPYERASRSALAEPEPKEPC